MSRVPGLVAEFASASLILVYHGQPVVPPVPIVRWERAESGLRAEVVFPIYPNTLVFDAVRLSFDGEPEGDVLLPDGEFTLPAGMVWSYLAEWVYKDGTER